MGVCARSDEAKASQYSNATRSRRAKMKLIVTWSLGEARLRKANTVRVREENRDEKGWEDAKDE